jgi:hypothetical protein
MAAESAGLVHVHDQQPGIRRKKGKRREQVLLISDRMAKEYKTTRRFNASASSRSLQPGGTYG